MFIKVLFTIAKIEKQPKGPLMDKWIKKMWQIYSLSTYIHIYITYAGDPGLIPGIGTITHEKNGYPLLYSCLENSKNTEACQATVIKKKKKNIATCNSMDGPWQHYAKWNKSDRERQIL